MAYSGRLSSTVLVLCVAAAISCRGSGEGPDTVGDSARPDKCADFNGEGSERVSGTLRGKSQAARSVAARIRPVEEKGKDNTADTVRLVPLCDNSTLERAQLVEGRFVGLLTGKGLQRLGLSDRPNDVVAWWVFGDTTAKDSSGADTTIWHSQFLSLTGRPTDPKSDTLIVCGPPQIHPDSAMVEWHSGICPDSIGIRSGDKPWFGCKLGCCVSAMSIS